MDKKTQIAQTILAELDHFDNLSVKYMSSTLTPLARRQTHEVYESQKHLLTEPFISYVKVREKVENGDWTERIYLVCRNYTPLGIEPITPSGTFLNRNAPAGTIASKDVGDEVEIFLPRVQKKLKKTFVILEKDIFTLCKDDKWDAKNNNIFYDFEEEFIPSLRDIIPFVKDSDSIDVRQKNIGLNLVREIEEAEHAARENRKEKILKKQKRTKAIVDSIALKDQPILDKSQDNYCRLPLSSQILLVGSPGTGKTTTLIKRISFKSDFEHLKTTDEIELEHGRLKNWLMFTPNELLKIYLKEAMNKEGLLATDERVVTWDKERTVLGRDILKFLKSPQGGVFARIADDILTDNTSSGLIKYTDKLTDYFNSTNQKNFFDATTLLEKNRPRPEIINKENSPLAQEFGRFIYNCKQIKNLIETRKISDADIKTLFLIDNFQKLKPQLTKLRSEIGALIKQVVDDFIAQQPQVFEQISEIVAESRLLPEQSEDTDLLEILPEIDDEDSDTADEPTSDEAEVDLRVETKRQIRRAFVRFAESSAHNRKLKNNRLIRIWELLAPFFADKNLLLFIGQINIALRQKVFGQLDYNRILEQIPIFYDKFRLNLLKEDPNLFNANSVESVKNKKISLNEIDILIYLILRFAGKIFQENRSFLRNPTKLDLLENIKTQYRTQIAVDEAADFSPVQLGCMYHLAHPEFKSVSFAGDLMQRVTTSGVTNWKECEFVSNDLQKQELVISYRQTPVLLQIAGKLYENTIGQKPPFHSKNADDSQDPRPLKFKADNNEELGEWVAQRVNEIYKINNSKLPSIAVFVPEENDIDLAYEIIQEKLNEISIDVDKCKEGKVLGTGSKVRIFSVDFIKGLEFEGVFFLGIDEIHDKKADLLDKYLYVGLTRATTFLGVTYNSQFPKKISFVEEDFKAGNWGGFVE
jgi:DNA polymerase III delta prime subunit